MVSLIYYKHNNVRHVNADCSVWDGDWRVFLTSYFFWICMTLPSPSRSRCWCWSPSVIFGRRRTALLVLNQRPVSVPLLISLWNLSTVRVCVDGGANQWHRITHGEHQNDIVQPIPDLVTGDFDSVLPEVLETYR